MLFVLMPLYRRHVGKGLALFATRSWKTGLLRCLAPRSRSRRSPLVGAEQVDAVGQLVAVGNRHLGKAGKAGKVKEVEIFRLA